MNDKIEISRYKLMQIMDIIERLRTYREGTYYHTEASVEGKKMVKEIEEMLK